MGLVPGRVDADRLAHRDRGRSCHGHLLRDVRDPLPSDRRRVRVPVTHPVTRRRVHRELLVRVLGGVLRGREWGLSEPLLHLPIPGRSGPAAEEPGVVERGDLVQPRVGNLHRRQCGDRAAHLAPDPGSRRVFPVAALGGLCGVRKHRHHHHRSDSCGDGSPRLQGQFQLPRGQRSLRKGRCPRRQGRTGSPGAVQSRQHHQLHDLAGVLDLVRGCVDVVLRRDQERAAQPAVRHLRRDHPHGDRILRVDAGCTRLPSAAASCCQRRSTASRCKRLRTSRSSPPLPAATSCSRFS